MRRYHYLATLGTLLIVMGLVVLLPVMAQDDGAEGATVPAQPEVLQGFYDAWVNSPHADVEAEAFNHWNEEEEQVVPMDCARCHSTPGYQDYLGADGSDFGVVDADAPLGTTVTCDACHNGVASVLSSVVFPSGVEITNVGDAARCMVCHQGRSSMNSVNDAIASAGVDQNTPSEDLRFINIHYYAAAATLYGSEAHGGYEFEGMTYQRRSDHVEGYDTCVGCHNPHTLELNVEECSACHEDVESAEDAREIRMNGSLSDYDGDGDIEEGIADEIVGLQEMLYAAMQAYASEVAGLPLLYSADSYPYVFGDTDGNGEVTEGEGAYNAFTPLLLQAAYNYQVSQKDPGAYAHNPKYIIELLYDSIVMLNAQISEPIDLSTAVRNDPGHFDSTAEAFRHWDEDGEVAGTCTKCHTADGLPFFLDEAVLFSREPSNSLECTTCHNDLTEFTLYTVNEVTMPSGAVVTFGEEEPSNVCLNCHQGRESTVSVNNAINRAGVGDDEVSEALSFRNVHYFAAGATRFGGDAMGGYQFEGQEYTGYWEHTRRLQTCTDCHEVHQLEIEAERCADCHEEMEDQSDPSLIRMTDEDEVELIDYDGDGDMEEPIAAEIQTLHDALYAQIQAYATDTIGTSVMYVSYAHPYWYVDANGNGVIDDGEVNEDSRYATWTPAMLRAAYNYQYVAKDTGAFAHNADYVLQLLFDSIQSLGGDEAVASFTRPPVIVSEDSDD
jgi:hypothetical protein